MTEVATKSIKPPHYDRVDFVPPDIRCQRVESRPAILRARQAVIDVFHGRVPRRNSAAPVTGFLASARAC